MRTASLIVLLTIIVCGSAVADRKTPPQHPYGMDAGQGIQPTPPVIDFRGVPVHSRLMSADGLCFGMNPEIYRPLARMFVLGLNGVPTQDATQAPVIAEFNFTCFGPRQTYGDVGFGKRGLDLGICFTNEKYIVRATVSFYENLTVGQEGSPDDFRCGRLVAGSFQGIGKANATTSWQAFLNAYSWVRGLNLTFGQEEWGNDKLQFKALCNSVENLKLVSVTTPPFPPY
jgi:hypothetical protein